MPRQQEQNVPVEQSEAQVLVEPEQVSVEQPVVEVQADAPVEQPVEAPAVESTQ